MHRSLRDSISRDADALLFLISEISVEALRVCVCVTCTRKGNLTHRRQPSRSSSNIMNFLQSLTIECKRCHFSRQQYYVTNSKLYSFLYAVQLVVKSFGWSKLDSRGLCIHVTSNINSIYERRKFYRRTSNYIVTK